ncbi:hypothetical protein RB595_001378 [Gaeumannomyces hyphopodioides]
MSSRACSPTVEPRGRHLPITAPISSPFPSGPGYAGPLKELIGEDAGHSAFNSHSSGQDPSNYAYTGDQTQYGQYYDSNGQLITGQNLAYGYTDEQGGGYFYADDGGYGTVYGGGGYYTTPHHASQPQHHDQQQQQLTQQFTQQLTQQLTQQPQLQPQPQPQQQAGGDMVTNLVRRRIIIRHLHDKSTYGEVLQLVERWAGADKGLLRVKHIPADASRGRKCHAFATYTTPEWAEAAIQSLNGKTVKTRQVDVRIANEMQEVFIPPQSGGEGSGSGNTNTNSSNNNSNNTGRRPRRRGAKKGGSEDNSRPVVADGSIAGKGK